VLAAQHLREWQASAQQVLYPGLRQPVLQWGAASGSNVANGHNDDVATAKAGSHSSMGGTEDSGLPKHSSSSSSFGDPHEAPGLEQSCRVSQLEASR
jgi:hypothetical protein